jgi:hypothetical protein
VGLCACPACLCLQPAQQKAVSCSQAAVARPQECCCKPARPHANAASAALYRALCVCQQVSHMICGTANSTVQLHYATACKRCRASEACTHPVSCCNTVEARGIQLIVML